MHENRIIVGYESAEKFYRRVRRDHDLYMCNILEVFYELDALRLMDEQDHSADTSIRPIGSPADLPTRARAILDTLGIEPPLDVIVGRECNRRNSELVRCHVWSGPLSDGLLAPIGDDCLVCAPELVALQLARNASLVETMQRVYELAGRFALSNAEHGMAKVVPRPISSIERMELLASLDTAVRGGDLMRRALRYASDNARSPMEAQVATLMSLPRRLGGQGLGPAELNARVDVNDAARKLTSHRFFELDMFYRNAGVDIEYGGYHHDNPLRRADDNERRAALMAMGIEVIDLSSYPLNSPDKLEGVADIISSRLGKRRRPATMATRHATGSLVRELQSMRHAPSTRGTMEGEPRWNGSSTEASLPWAC